MKPLYLLCLLLTSCAVTKQPPKSYYEQEEAYKDSAQTGFTRDSPFRPANYAAPLKGSEARQYRKNLKAETKLAQAQKASVPKKLGKGAVYAPNAAGPVSAAYKPAAPVQVGDSSTLNAVTGGGALATVVGDGNDLTLTPTTEEAPSPLAVVADNLTGPVGYVLGIGLLAAIVWGVVAYRRSRAAARIIQEPTKNIG